MKRYRFRLAQVQRVRQIEEERARAALSSARRAEDHASIGVAVRRAALAADPGVAAAVDAASVEAAATRLALHRLAVERAEERRAAAAEATRRRVDEWVAASRALEVLARLDARRRAEWAAEVARRTDRDSDDLVTGRSRKRAPW